MMLKRIALVVGAIAVTSLSVPPTVSGGRMIERDFRSTYTATYQLDTSSVQIDCPAGWNTNLLLGEGVGTMIGRFDLRIEACVHPVIGEVYGTAYYTAANGDLLAFEFEGSIVAVIGTTLVAELPATGTFGDGRFAGVELGAVPGIATDFSDPFAGTSYGVVSGSIVYDASSRSAK